MHALELNDARLILATDTAAQIVANAPGIACVSDGGIVVGAEAAAQAKLQPQRIHQRYWRDLSVTSLGRAPRPELSAADLAFEQLRALLAAAGVADQRDVRLLIGVPPGYSREQLGLLLGIATEAGATEIGLVDIALAACALAPVPRHVVHLELYRHCAVLTAIEQAGGGARRARYEIEEQCSSARLEQLCLEMIAAQFVRQTRFDPLHHARTEQLLVDEVPRLLNALSRGDAAPVSIEAGGESLQVEISGSQWLATAEAIYAALLQLVQRARPAGQAVELRIGAQAQSYPGLVDRLSTLKSCQVTLLPEGAAARGALLHAGSILRGAEPALICQLPLALLTDENLPAPVSVTPSEHTAAMHLLFAGRAWPLAPEPLTIGTQVPAGIPALQVPGGTPGISRVHCRVRLRDGMAHIEDLSTYGSFVNDERVHGSVALQRGDRLRLGTPGLILDVIEVVNGYATPPL